MRIEEHPILGVTPKRDRVTFTYDGRLLEGYEGEMIAAALRAEGIMIHRYTKKQHKPRGVFCAIGRCTDCVMVVNGKLNVRTCITSLEAGMIIQTQDGVAAKDTRIASSVIDSQGILTQHVATAKDTSSSGDE